KFRYKKIKFGFDLSHFALWHFFYENLHMHFNIFIDKPIYNNGNIFFLPECYKSKLSIEEIIYFAPRTININHLISKNGNAIDEIENMMCKIRNKYSNFYKIEMLKKANKNYELTIWISLVWRNGQKKTWLNQFDSICNVLKELNRYFGKIRILIDGYKDFENYTESVCGVKKHVISLQNIDRIISDFRKLIEPYVEEIIVLNGYIVKEAMQYCFLSDISISEAASGAIIPTSICKISSILYGRKEYVNFCNKILPNNYKVVEDQYIYLKE
ncbi:TPA: hypothetical protein R1710_001609, partial [Campylobacter lari]|nr:hypothetical protein [Campylobacter lari]